MSDRIDELKGNVKKTVGKVTDNERLEAEGKVEAESARAERHVKGAANQVTGTVQETVGKVTDNERLEAEGTVKRVKGEGQTKG